MGGRLPVEQVAEKIGTIPYELLTRLTSRVHLTHCDKREQMPMLKLA